MVFIQFKKSDRNTFTLQFTSNTIIATLIANIIQINNIRIYLDRLIWSVEELANKGVLKPQQLQGVSFEDYQKNPQQFNQLTPSKKQYAMKPKVSSPYRYVTDKNNQRYGVILSQSETKPMLQALNKAKAVMEAKKQLINQEQLLAAIQELRISVALTYPAYLNLPQWEPTVLLLEEKVDLQILQSDNFEYYPKNSSIWWAGKELEKSKKLSEYIGNNEKTRVIVKLQKPGGQQPNREPPVDSQTYSKMVRYYYRKVDENKQFDKKNAQNYYEEVEVHSMKAKVHLDNDIKYKPF